MSEPIRLHTPLTQEKTSALRAGDLVLLSGTIYAARDAAHKKLDEALDLGEVLPVDLKDQVVYYVGPSPARPGEAIGSAGPTTSGRMDRYTPRLLKEGLKGMIGKGNRSQAVLDAIKEHKAVYFAATGGAGALLARAITGYTVLAYPELGPEALAELTVVDFPLIVVADAHGNDFYKQSTQAWANKAGQAQ